MSKQEGVEVMKNLIKLILLVATFCVSFGHADNSISYGIGTVHVVSPDDLILNENNKILMINIDSLLIGKMITSYHRQSYMVGMTTQNRFVNYAFVIANGYKAGDLLIPTPFEIVVYPTISLATPSYNNVSLTLNYSGIVFTGAVKINF